MFTFVVISYNQEEFILEALESIKYQIIHYGKGKDIQIIVADDGYIDKTYLFENVWLEKNLDLFADIVILPSDINRGINQNYVRALDRVKGEYWRGLAGDDLVANADIFTPVCGDINIFSFFGFRDYQLFPISSDTARMNACYLFWGEPADEIKQVSRFLYAFSSPCWVINRKIYDKGLRDTIGKYTYIEDVPMWDYIMRNHDVKFNYINTPVGLRRLSIKGITNQKNALHLPHLADRRKYYNNKVQQFRFPLDKYIAKMYAMEEDADSRLMRKIYAILNPYKYYFKWKQWERTYEMRKLAEKMDEDYFESNQKYLLNIRDCAKNFLDSMR